SPGNPGYAETVYRTNMMDAYTTGMDRERQAADVRDFFPVWRYRGISDGRQRASHEVHFDHYFSNETTLAEVRDSVKGSSDGFNCRCVRQEIDRYEWEDLQGQGVKVNKFAETAPVPTLPQHTPYSCGPAAIREVLVRYGIKKSEEELREMLGT